MGNDSLHNIHVLDKIPPEILCKFFESTYDPSHNSMLTAFRISQVCRRWRETALSSQILWSAIQLSTGSSVVHELCLSRAGSLPLSVAIKILGAWPWPSEDGIRENIRRFAKHYERMVSIDIEAPYAYRSLFQNLDFAAPRLVQFSCTVTPGLVYRSPLPSPLFPPYMPLLRVLRLKGFEYVEVAKFSNLVDIQLTANPVYLRGTILIEVLRRSPLVERLEIEGYWIRDDENTTLRPRIELPRLTKLRLGYASSRFILSWLDTPAITHFIVTNPLTSYHGRPIHPSLPEDPDQLMITRRLKTLIFTALRCLISEDLAIKCHDDRGSIVHKDIDPGRISETWKYFSSTSLTSLTLLAVDIGEFLVPSEDTVRAFYANVPSLRDLRILQHGCMVFVWVFIDGDDLCPDLGSVRVRLRVNESGEDFDRTFGVVERVVRAREAIGRTVRVGFDTGKGGLGEDVRRVWDALCDKHRVQRL